MNYTPADVTMLNKMGIQIGDPYPRMPLSTQNLGTALALINESRLVEQRERADLAKCEAIRITPDQRKAMVIAAQRQLALQEQEKLVRCGRFLLGWLVATLAVVAVVLMVIHNG